MRHFIALSFVALLCSVTGPSLASSDDLVTNFELQNGMQVVVVEDHRAASVQHMVWYRVGSADEPLGQSGIAHFLEHLMFKATDTRAAGELSSIVAANGGRDNAFTSYDYTAYFQRVSSDRLELMMTLEADRMRNLRLTLSEIDTERGVVLEERNQRTENDPSALFREQVGATLYDHHSYGIPIIGWRHEIEEIDKSELEDFYELHYHPNNAILVVSGDVDAAEVKRLAEIHYGTIPSGPHTADRPRAQEPPHRSERRVIYQDPRVSQPYMTRSYIAPERDHGDQETAAALTVLAQLLGGGVTGELVTELQFEQEIALYAGAFYSGVSLDKTRFDLVVVPAPGVSLEDAEKALDRALNKFLETEIDLDALDRLKYQMRAAEIYERDDVGQIARRYGAALASGLTVEDVKAWPELLQSVTAEDIMRAAEQVLIKERSVTGWLMQAEQNGLGVTQ